jgi:hypothetical protein
VGTVAYTLCRELMKSMGKVVIEKLIIHVTLDGHGTAERLSLLFILLVV